MMTLESERYQAGHTLDSTIATRLAISGTDRQTRLLAIVNPRTDKWALVRLATDTDEAFSAAARYALQQRRGA